MLTVILLDSSGNNTVEITLILGYVTDVQHGDTKG